MAARWQLRAGGVTMGVGDCLLSSTSERHPKSGTLGLEVSVRSLVSDLARLPGSAIGHEGLALISPLQHTPRDPLNRNSERRDSTI